jgi:hypothetical protein
MMTITLSELRDMIRKTVSSGGAIFWVVAETDSMANPLDLISKNGLSQNEWESIMHNIFICRGFNFQQTQSILSHLSNRLNSEKSLSICLFSGLIQDTNSIYKKRFKNTLVSQVELIAKQHEKASMISFILGPDSINSLSSPQNIDAFLSIINAHQGPSKETFSGENHIMGKSTPTFRELVQLEKQLWSDYTHSLSREEKKRFDRLFNKALFLAPAAGEMAGKKDPLILMLMNIFMEMESRIENLEEELSASLKRNNDPRYSE